jgi:DNA adenine methylase
VEVYGGGLSVTFAKDPNNVSEVVNDRYRQLQTFWTVLQKPDLFERFMRRIEATPFSQIEWEAAHSVNESDLPEDQVGQAVALFIACRQSRAGALRAFATLSRTRTRRAMNEQVSAWLSAIEGLAEVHRRLQRIVILCDLALNVIRSQDGPDTLFYLDPPYLPDCRVSKKVYAHEMSVEDHQELLNELGNIQGKFLLSGYPSEMYLEAERLYGWKRHEKNIPNHVSGAATRPIMTECVWTKC